MKNHSHLDSTYARSVQRGDLRILYNAGYTEEAIDTAKKEIDRNILNAPKINKIRILPY